MARADERSEQHRTDRAEHLSDSEEDSDSLGPDLHREGLGHRQVCGARARRGEEEIAHQAIVCVVAVKAP